MTQVFGVFNYPVSIFRCFLKGYSSVNSIRNFQNTLWLFFETHLGAWCSFLLVEPTLEKLFHCNSRFSREHDIGVYFNLISPLLSWLHNCNDQLCLHIFLRSSNMIFHIFTCILHYLRVYYELTKWPAPRWLDCSVGRALHRHRRTHGLESHSGQIFFGFIFTILLKLCA